MARKSGKMRSFNVSVVGLSGTEKEKGQVGVGKSCLCNRFMAALADDYSVDHISVLSQTDFSGRVVNNDHFLYWGEVAKTSEDGIDFLFQVIEQTEFIDDATFQPFKGSKMEPYAKRCSATKITSAEKLMYICKNQLVDLNGHLVFGYPKQLVYNVNGYLEGLIYPELKDNWNLLTVSSLGIEREYEQKLLPDGKISIDGFLCIFDVSSVPSRPIEKQADAVTAILNNLMKTKKPIVLVTTKNDDANETYVKEAEKLVNRKEYKGGILLVETSAHENINVDTAFIVLAQQIDRSKGRARILPFIEAARVRKEMLDQSTEALQTLIRSQVSDYRATWSQTSKKLFQHKEFVHFVELFGIESAQRLFKRHLKKLQDEHFAKKVQGYMDLLPDVLQEMFPDITALRDLDWPTVQLRIKEHPEFNQYFYECPEDVPWTEYDLDDHAETRIPYEVLDTSEAEATYNSHVSGLQQEQKRLEWKKQFKQLLEDTGYVTPGKALSEVRVLFMGRECFEALSEQDCQHIYDQHQKEIIEKAKHNFQELLLEHADLFYHFKSIAPEGTITQDDIKEITDALQDDSRYKALDRIDQDRKLMLFQHLGFVHCPIREHCPAFPNCMDALIERILRTRAHRPSSWNHSNQWRLNSDNNQINLVILGSDGLAEELASEIRVQCDEDEYELDCRLYTLDYRIIDGDVSLPENSFKGTDFMPNGCFCVYSNPETFEYVRESLEKTLLSNLEQDDRLPFQGLPIVMLFLPDPSVDENDVLRLREEGQSLSDSLQCPFIDVSLEDVAPGQRFTASLIAEAMGQLIQSIHHRAVFLNVYQSILECSEPDIRFQEDMHMQVVQKDRHIQEAHIFKGGTNMIWRGIMANQRNNLVFIYEKTNENRCIQDVLQPVFLIAGAAGPELLQMHSNAKAHIAGIIMCMFCGDPYSVENVLGPLLSHQCCFLSGDRSIILETFLDDSKRKVEVIISSFHGANAFREELVHGFILVYSAKRRASLATLNAFSMNIPNLPIQVLAVTDSGGANAFFSSDLSHLLITEGNATADRLKAHFMTSVSSCQQKTAFFTPFFKEVWEKKPEIEQAFHMEEPINYSNSAESTLEMPPRQPRPPPRHESYHIKAGSNEGSMCSRSGSELYDIQPNDGLLDDMTDLLSAAIPEDRMTSSSDESYIYSDVELNGDDNSEPLVKPAEIKTSDKLHHGHVKRGRRRRARN